MPGAELVEESVDRQGLIVDGRLARRRMSCIDEVAVVVPLQVGEVEVDDECVDRAQDVVERGWVREVEDLLMPRAGRQVAARAQDPVGVLPGEVGVLVGHLRLEPETELHPERVHVPGEWLQTVRPTFGIGCPVAETAAVVVSAPEPAVVEDVAFDPEGCGLGGEFSEGVEVLVEHHRLPDVQRDRPGLPRGPRALAEEPVEARGCCIETHSVAAVHPG